MAPSSEGRGVQLNAPTFAGRALGSEDMLRDRSILLLSTEPWFGPLLSKHHFALQLARHNRVLFVDPAYTLADLARLRWSQARFPEHYHDLQPENLTRLRPWRLPRDRYSRGLTWLSHQVLVAQVRRLKFCPHLIVSFDPAYSLLTRYWRAPFVYISMDSQTVPAATAQALRSADLVVAGSDRLYQRYLGHTRRLVYLPHGVDLEVLTRHAGQTPPDMAQLPRPIAGFVGALNSRLDLNLLEQLSSSRPSLSIALIGPYARGSYGGGLGQPALARLRRLANVHLLGPKPTEALGAYISALDVALVPYDVRQSNVQFDYHKTLQILALGKPMVTTCPVPAAEAVPNVYSAETAEAFVAAVDRALVEQDDARSAAGREFARQNTWERRGQQLEELLAPLSQ